MNQTTPNSSSSRFTELGLFFKVHTWFILLASLVGVLIRGYVGINQGFDWTYLTDYQTYINLVFSMIIWGLVLYFAFWKFNPNFRSKMREKFESKN
ncbi:hypothetical protein [Algoriphagus sp.]|uniref:hypothetical protein n=1 Tax=Algoriphagus sp. TaxID=1872435 RepID=UPI00261AE688|nr:hypothetical protein [Algoriphagus sp.]